MEALLEKAIDGLNLDRSDWQLVKFGDVAIQQKQKVDRENTDLTRYVKGEHMYSEDLHLREWGELTDEYLGPAFIRKFEEGDILYGSRRTYLRKVVIAPFEGITSNTTFVIKANEERIDKRLLPFIMLSEGFSQHSIRNSKGSVNPYVNWKDLAGHEFLLPPIEQQEKFANLFESIDEFTESELRVLSNSEQLFSSMERDLLDDAGNPSLAIMDVASVQRGKFSHRPRNAPQFYGGDIPFIQTSEVVNSGKYINSFTQTLNNLGLSISRLFEKNTIVMTIAANIGHVGMLAFDSAFTDSLVGIQANEDLISQDYLFYYLNYKQKEIEQLSTESAQKNLSLDRFKAFVVKFPVSRKTQGKVTGKLDRCRENNLLIQVKVDTSLQLKKSLINQVF